jgi:hypothetical protein
VPVRVAAPAPAVGRRRRGRAPARAEQLRFVPAAPAAPASPPALDLPAAPEARAADERPRGGLTLDDVLVGVWEGLSAGEEVTCPVCRSGALAHEPADGRRATIVRCSDCASRLA